jgi:non-homologous end joining protein Ku
MARAIWSGVVSFGLVAIPVELYSATEPHRPAFQFEEAAKPYTLLRDAMEDSGKAAIASFVMRGEEYLAAVRADGGLLALETLFFADEVRDP